jgi:hypothetical protein
VKIECSMGEIELSFDEFIAFFRDVWLSFEIEIWDFVN